MRIGLIDNLGSDYYTIRDSISTASAEDILSASGGNTGNVAYVYGSKKILGDPILRVKWGDNYKKIKQDCDVIVVSCANQIGGHTDLQLWSEMLEALKLPVVLLGLGAQSSSYEAAPDITPGTMRFLKVVSSLRANPKYPNIACRGSYTSEFLHSLGIDSIPLTCPSLFISSNKNLGSQILEAQKNITEHSLSVLAGNPFDTSIASIEHKLTSLVDEFSGSYVLQHPLGVLKLGLGENSAMTTKEISFYKKLYKKISTKQLFDWFKVNSFISIDPESWLFESRRCTGLIGPRFHGVALGIQAGKPGVIVTSDSRTAELSLSSSIKSVNVKEFMATKNKDIPKLISWSKKDCVAFDINRAEMADLYKIFLTKNKLIPSNHLLNLI